MARRLILSLNYETRVTPGACFHLKTDWFNIDEEIETIIIDQSNIFSKLLSIYPNGFFVYLEQSPEGAICRTNYPLNLKDGEDHYIVDWELETV